MNTYLVGGAVRDQLLGFPVTERDWLVVGATPQQLLDLGYLPVGKDFPVFLHPETREEYALARTERKTAPGYKGFSCDSSISVTINEDLLRRDLTINAMALSDDGQIIDPYHGQQDMQNRLLRHVSPAFSEDPVRVLRVARFAARYAHLGFRVAEETNQLMRDMVNSGEVAHLVAERVWAELYKALGETKPSVFFQVLRDCDALAVIFPEIEALFGVPQPAKYHPEIDTGVHCMMVLDTAAQLTDKREVRLAALLHDLGKALTDPERWPSHQGHEHLGLAALEQLCQRLRVPNTYKRLAEQVMHYHTHCHKVFELRPGTLVDMLHHLGAHRDLDYLNDFLLACEADARGRTGFENSVYPQADFIRNAAHAANQVDVKSIVASGLQGGQIAEAVRQARTNVIKHCQQQYSA